MVSKIPGHRADFFLGLFGLFRQILKGRVVTRQIVVVGSTLQVVFVQ